MLNRLSSYFLIVAAGIFAAVQGFAIVKHGRLETWLTTHDYINAAKIAVALTAIVVAIWSLKRDKNSLVSKRTRSPLGAPRSLADTLRQVTTFSIRHPWLTPLFIFSLLIIPVGLRALEKPHGWNNFGIRDWILIGIAEIPFVLLAILSVIANVRSIAKKRAPSKSQSEETRL